MNVLALDPAASTGFCVLQVLDSNITIKDYGFIELDNDTDYNGDRCIELMNKVEGLIQTYDIHDVCIEDFFFSKRFANGCDVNAAFRTAIHIRIRECGLPYTIINISEWKKFTAGRSTPTVEQKKKWGKEPAKKLMIQQALWDKYQIRFANHSLSKKTGKPIKFRYDIVDAVAQGIYYCRIYLNGGQVSCEVQPPQDIEFKIKPKVMYEYT